MADIVQAALGLEKAKAGARMAKSDISGFTDPIQKQVGEITERNKEARKNFVSNIPDNYEFDLIPAEAKAKLTTFLKDKKQEYIDFADQAGRYSGNTSSKEYTDAVEGMENVKAAMNKNYDDLVVAKQIRQYELANEKQGTVGFVGDEDADSRRTAIMDGSTFNNVEFTDDGAFINDGFGEKISWSKYNKSPVRNVKAAEAFADLKSDVRKLGSAGKDEKTVRDVVETELGMLFANEEFADEIYNMGVYGDKRGKTVYKNIPGATKENMFDFFVDMVINDSYNPSASLIGRGRSRTPLSQSRISEINIFKNSVKRSVETGQDITFPNGEIGKITSGGNIQLYSKKGGKLEMLPISLDQAMDRAEIPLEMRGDVKPIENKTSTKGGRYSQFKN